MDIPCEQQFAPIAQELGVTGYKEKSEDKQTMLTQNSENKHKRQNGFCMVSTLEEVYGGKEGLPKDRRIGSEVQR